MASIGVLHNISQFGQMYLVSNYYYCNEPSSETSSAVQTV